MDGPVAMEQREIPESAERPLATPPDPAQSRFLATVSHEMRTPLAGILGMADLLIGTRLTPEQATYVAAVKSSGESLLSLVEDILDFSRLEAGRLELEPAPFPLAEFVEGVVELLAPRAQAKGLDIAAQVDDDLPDRVVGDAARLRQVLLNLAGNAVKFTESGGFAIEVAAAAEAGRVTFRVRDTGIGIPAEAQARIFAAFEQGDASAARRFAGTGLGLTISQHIVERMGARISVESSPGAGATFEFTVRLPAAEGAKPLAMPDLTGRSILWASASPVAAPLLAARLRRWGAAVAHVASVAQAQERLISGVDALVVDYALGEEAKALAGCRTVPLRLVLVGPGERRNLDDLKEAGFSGYLVKPVRSVSLAARFAAAPGLDTSFAEPSRVSLPRASRRLSVLVAEDNEVNALLARALLVKLGHRPALAVNGAEAVARWREAQGNEPYDIVLMDVHMPGMDGLQATRRIRDLEADGRRTPIIALTANALAQDRAACLAAGMDAFLTKPLDLQRLTEALAALVPPPSASHAA